MNFFSNHIPCIIDLCKKHKVKRLFAFGSVLTSSFNNESDVDLVVDFENITPEDYVDNYFNLKEALSSIFHRKVDLLEDRAIRNPVLRRNIDRSKQLLYG